MSEQAAPLPEIGTTAAQRWREFAASYPRGREVDEGGAPISSWRRFLIRFRRQRPALVALGFLCTISVVAILAPVVAPYDPAKQDLNNVLGLPSATHLLGTDENGRDSLSRVIYGARIGLLASLEAVGIAVLLGVIPGLLAGYLGGWVDMVVMRIAEGLMSFPHLLLAIAIVGVLGPGLQNAMLAVGITMSPRFCRLVRGSVLSAREEVYVEAARSIGCSTPRILRMHLLPNVLSPLIVQISLVAATSMLIEASLSFLGLGVVPPDASWGSMLSRAARFAGRQPFLAIPPGVMITLTVLSFNVLGDGIRDSLGREIRKES